MAAQGERVPGVVGMDGGVLESMVQDTREEDTTLPQGWEKWGCHASGLFYFYDRTTKCRQWGRPGRTTEQQLVETTE